MQTVRGQWLTAPEFAEKAGIDRRSAARILGGRPPLWRGALLEVRVAHGRGGRGGARFEVSLRSLSEALERKSSITPVALPSTVQPRAAALIDSALAADTPQARAEIVRALAETTGKSVRTVQRAVAKVKDGGHVAA